MVLVLVLRSNAGDLFGSGAAADSLARKSPFLLVHTGTRIGE
jgi:hypothetical protein